MDFAARNEFQSILSGPSPRLSVPTEGCAVVRCSGDLMHTKPAGARGMGHAPLRRGSGGAVRRWRLRIESTDVSEARSARQAALVERLEHARIARVDREAAGQQRARLRRTATAELLLAAKLVSAAFRSESMLPP